MLDHLIDDQKVKIEGFQPSNNKPLFFNRNLEFGQNEIVKETLDLKPIEITKHI